MPKPYHQHTLALTDEEEKKLIIVKDATGFGVKKIFMAMVDALMPDKPEDLIGGNSAPEED